MGDWNPLKEYEFHELTFHQRVSLIKALCDYILVRSLECSYIFYIFFPNYVWYSHCHEFLGIYIYIVMKVDFDANNEICSFQNVYESKDVQCGINYLMTNAE
jgi:hypothetical protein